MRLLSAVLAAWPAVPTTALRRPEDKQALEPWVESSQERSEARSATFQDPQHQNWTDGSLATPAFQNVLLVVHCRGGNVRGQARPESTVCRDSEWISRHYAPHFGDVFYMTRYNHCNGGAGDPHVCLAELMQTRGANRTGILYIHFDALINPRNFAIGFNTEGLGSFTFPVLRRLDGRFRFPLKWPHYDQVAWKRAWVAASRIMGHAPIVDNRTVYVAVDDVFYIPRGAYKLYAQLAKAFAESGVFHELAGPTIRTYISSQLHIEHQDFGCAGSCCSNLKINIALDPNFTCGHKFAMNNRGVQRMLSNVIMAR